MNEQADQRSRLVGVKLRTLVREHLSASDADIGQLSPYGPGAALLHAGGGWVFLDRDPANRLGAALAWAVRAGADRLDVIADDDEGVGCLARRAELFEFPVSVWKADGRSLLPATALPRPVPPPVPESHLEFESLIIEGGAAPVVEHGVLIGEVKGLEVCRVIEDQDLGGTRLAVGTGSHDREAFQLMHGEVPTVESLRRVVGAVAEHRQPGARQHPLSRLAAERMLRWQLEQDPLPIGAAALAPTNPPVPRRNLKDPTPCVATGLDIEGRPVVVVCSTGVDLELVPFAADAHAAAVDHGGDGGDKQVRLVIVTPIRDRLPITETLATFLKTPVEYISV